MGCVWTLEGRSGSRETVSRSEAGKAEPLFRVLLLRRALPWGDCQWVVVMVVVRGLFTVREHGRGPEAARGRWLNLLPVLVFEEDIVANVKQA